MMQSECTGSNPNSPALSATETEQSRGTLKAKVARQVKAK